MKKMTSMTDIDGSKIVKTEINTEKDNMTKNKSTVDVRKDDNDRRTNGNSSDIKLFSSDKNSQILLSQSFSSIKYDDGELLNTADSSCDEKDGY